MRPCPQCGTPCQEAAWTCPTCGRNLGNSLGQTVVGHSTGPLEDPRTWEPPPATPPLQQPAPAQAAAPPPAQAQPPAQAAPSTNKFRGTMLGMGLNSPVAAPVAAQAPAPPGLGSTIAMSPQSAYGGTLPGGAPVPGGVPSAAAPVGRAAFKGTMIGMAAPAMPMGMPPAPPPPPEPPPAGPGGPEVPGNRQAGHMKTMLGVARPGIAPLNPGMAKAEPAPIPEPPPVWQQPEPPAPTWNESAPGTIPGLPRKRTVPWLAVLVIVGAATLATAVVVAALFYRARGAVETRLLSDDSGRDKLELTCKGCADGAKVTLGSSKATFKAGRAALTLAKPLEVGDQRVTVDLERAPGRSDRVEVTVPVDFRIRPDTSKLTETPPRVEARVAARPGSAVVVDGRALTLGADGRASTPIDVEKALTGPEPGTKTLERRIPYVVTPPGGTPQNGEVVVRIGIAPLVVQAPGPSLVIDGPSFVLAGRAGKNAVVTVEGRPITVDPAGTFAQMMSVSSVGETNIIVRASVPELAPRLVVLRIRRVASLAGEAAVFRARATTSYSAIATDAEGQKGLSVALDGSVVEARTDAFTTVAVMDVKSGCSAAPCLLRFSWGAKSALSEGDPVSVFGSLTGSVEGPQAGTRIPAVTADFLIKGRK